MRTTRIRFGISRYRRDKRGRRKGIETRSGVVVVRATWRNPLFHGLALQAIDKKRPKGWSLMGYAKVSDRAGSRKKKGGA